MSDRFLGPVISVACACGRTASVPCPTIADIPAAWEKLDGWGHGDDGLVRCADCLAGRPMASATEPMQVDLFGEAAE